MSTTIYTPEDVYSFARHGDEANFIVALNQGDNSTNWYRGDDGDTVCHEAATDGSINIVEMILDRGFDIHDKNFYGSTILHYAALFGHINIMEMLLERGFDTNSKTNDGGTALHITARNGCC